MENIHHLHDNVITKAHHIKKYTLTNKNGMQLDVINLGGIITSLTAPDNNGNFENIVLGNKETEAYFTGNPYYLGAIIGRYANRIANSKFALDGKIYEIGRNEALGSLHGGKEGFHKKFWNVERIIDSVQPTLKLTYESMDGEEGFPGNLKTTVLYTLTDDNGLEISYKAQTDKTTVINLTQHAYFNLSGNFSNLITDHELQINGTQFLPIDQDLIPTGEYREVKNTPFDFINPKVIGKDINSHDDQLRLGNGYDHNWILEGEGLRTVAKVFHSGTGRLMEVITDQPAVQFYSGNFLTGKIGNKADGELDFRTGFCLETQHFPDSPNQTSFPSTELRSDDTYMSKTIYKFSIRDKLL